MTDRLPMLAAFTRRKLAFHGQLLRSLRGDEPTDETPAPAEQDTTAPEPRSPRPDPSQGQVSATPLNGDLLATQLRRALRR